MTVREKRLMVGLLVVVGVVGSVFIAKSAFLDPLDEINDEKFNLEARIAENEKKIDEWNAYQKSLETLNPRIAQWRKTSLPESDKFDERSRDQRAFQTHLSWLRKSYEKYLTDLLTKSKIEGAKVNPLDVDKRAAAGAKYQVLAFSIKDAFGDQAAIRKFVTEFEKTPLLQEVRHFLIERQGTTSKLKMTMTVEVLLVTGAETVKARTGILPQFTGKGADKPPEILARSDSEYALGDKKTIFEPLIERVDRGPVEPVDPTPVTRGENPEDVLSYVRLTLITESPYYNCRIARLNNLGNRADANRGESVLLCDAALPTDSPFQVEKKERAKLRDKKPKKPAADPSPLPRVLHSAADTEETSISTESTPLEEPARRWVIRDKYKETVIEMQVVKIDPLRVIIQVEDKFYSVAVGDTLWDSMEEPIGKDELKKLNLLADKDDVLKKVKLAKLVTSTDRRNEYEATFVNPENKDEKVVLALEPAGEELSATDTWSVRDRFKAEVAKIKMANLSKDGVVFAAFKKYYRIKLNQTLFDALAKPLAEEDVKKLKLPAL